MINHPFFFKRLEPGLRARMREGFSLLELSVVLTVVGLISAGGMMFGMQQVETAKRVQTENKLKVIEDALMAFRTINGRLPCPADVSLAKTHANFGLEAANPGSCTGGAPTANFTETEEAQ